MNDRQDGHTLETLAVHAGRRVDSVTGAVTPPLYAATTFERDPDTGTSRGYSYQRDAHPNGRMFEAAMTALEGGAWAVAFASGLAASLALFRAAARRGRIVASSGSYWGTLGQLDGLVREWGAQVAIVDTSDLAAVRDAVGAGTSLVFVETPSNPLLALSDIAELAAICRDGGALLACDNTFATPVLQNPLALGADVVVHSATKYLGGHSDLMGGVVVGAVEDEWAADVLEYRAMGGAVLAPFNAWLLLRSLATLPVRMRAQSAHALELARRLSGHRAVSAVHYPGLPDHPGHALALAQMQGFGAMLAVRHAGGAAAARTTPAKVRLFTHATSLGGVESLIEHRASSEGPGSRTPPDLLRISVGLEHPEDLWEDLERALAG